MRCKRSGSGFCFMGYDFDGFCNGYDDGAFMMGDGMHSYVLSFFLFSFDTRYDTPYYQHSKSQDVFNHSTARDRVCQVLVEVYSSNYRSIGSSGSGTGKTHLYYMARIFLTSLLVCFLCRYHPTHSIMTPFWMLLLLRPVIHGGLADSTHVSNLEADRCTQTGSYLRPRS